MRQYHIRDVCCHLANDRIYQQDFFCIGYERCRLLPNYFGPCLKVLMQLIAVITASLTDALQTTTHYCQVQQIVVDKNSSYAVFGVEVVKTIRLRS